ncbi:MAG: GNAT family N-acetyltransferase [candidate division KSB1 bacterium]|nr:GNAT family N-acetyltransferase [candidate division KSB1 bacterium]MDZ7272840.1 GNAT family N-acetyltransferase [candidate division KSB1 bacterium]MDZ7284137.1 GNAT family N-acetyltransferase [candidate division KSB1 bacterium]MDZ7297465.1 GNAT family N-acetyltransferase [candidate division KSB1 bacterium]MDZ7305601.1 GNAT family N-acetyltransferase [candidate division KSB1 bacterium]
MITIRPLSGAAEIHACAHAMSTSEPWLTLGRGYEECAALLSEAGKEVYVAVAQEEPAGCIIINMQGAFRGYLQTVCVMPAWRGRGIGSELIRFAEKRIFQEAPNVFLCVSSFNTGAQKLYRRLGYEVIGELKDYVVAGHAEILMRKTIGPLAGFRGREKILWNRNSVL